MTDLSRMAVETALRNMFRGHMLDICTIKAALKIAKVLPPAEEFDAIAVLHCVHWSEMQAGLRDEAARTILGWFVLPGFDPFEEQTRTHGGLWSRLLGGGNRKALPS